jgi:electron transport complex protein RnfB
MAERNDNVTRRRVLRDGLWGACLAGIGGVVGFSAQKGRKDGLVWQIDPYKCIACGNCATYCVLEESAVKCMHVHAVCGYCRICFGFFTPDPFEMNEGAENQTCPTGAIIRKFVEDPYYEYSIDESLCNGCGKCVKGCNAFGNGSLFLQVQHDRCVNCNQCAIAVACPAQAFRRVPSSAPYLLKSADHA